MQPTKVETAVVPVPDIVPESVKNVSVIPGVQDPVKSPEVIPTPETGPIIQENVPTAGFMSAWIDHEIDLPPDQNGAIHKMRVHTPGMVPIPQIKATPEPAQDLATKGE